MNWTTLASVLFILCSCAKETSHEPRLYKVDDHRLKVTCVFDLDWKTMSCYPLDNEKNGD